MPQYLSVNGALQKELLRGLDRHDNVVNHQNHNSDHPDINKNNNQQQQQQQQKGIKKSIQEGQQIYLNNKATSTWSFQLLPTLYSHYQKVSINYEDII